MMSPSNPDFVCPSCTAAKVTIVMVTSASNPDVMSSTVWHVYAVGVFPSINQVVLY